MNTIQGNVWNTQTTPALPTKYYLGWSSTLPTVAATNVTEPSGNGYSRIEITGLSTPIGGLIKNTTNLYFPISTGSQGTAAYYVIYDALSSGNLCVFGAFTSSKVVNAGIYFRILANEIELQLSNAS